MGQRPGVPSMTSAALVPRGAGCKPAWQRRQWQQRRPPGSGRPSCRTARSAGSSTSGAGQAAPGAQPPLQQPEQQRQPATSSTISSRQAGCRRGGRAPRTRRWAGKLRPHWKWYTAALPGPAMRSSPACGTSTASPGSVWWAGSHTAAGRRPRPSSGAAAATVVRVEQVVVAAAARRERAGHGGRRGGRTTAAGRTGMLNGKRHQVDSLL